MLRLLKSFFRPRNEPVQPEAPYKVEAPVVETVVANPEPAKPKKARAPAKPKTEKKPAAIKAPRKPKAK